MKTEVMRKLRKPFLSIHRLLAKVGLLVVPSHYYSNVPNPHHLENTVDEWAFASDLPGIETNLDEQFSNLEEICMPYQDEYNGNQFYKEAVEGNYGPGFGYIEAQALHSVIRNKKPDKIIEIGSGVSTYLMNESIKLNIEESGGDGTDLTCIEPFPNENLLKLEKQNKHINIVDKKVQNIDGGIFDSLGKNDLLFIDSSHTVKPGSDVNHIYLEILPRLSDGVIIHCHDIYLPYDYKRDTLQTYFHWSETSLLRALLTNNNSIDILFCMSHLHYEKQNELRSIFPDYNPQSDERGLVHNEYEPFENINEHFPASIFLKKSK